MPNASFKGPSKTPEDGSENQFFKRGPSARRQMEVFWSWVSREAFVGLQKTKWRVRSLKTSLDASRRHFKVYLLCFKP